MAAGETELTCRPGPVLLPSSQPINSYSLSPISWLPGLSRRLPLTPSLNLTIFYKYIDFPVPFQGDYDVHLAEGDCQAQKAVDLNPKDV